MAVQGSSRLTLSQRILLIVLVGFDEHGPSFPLSLSLSLSLSLGA